jgi:hypothetical protein
VWFEMEKEGNDAEKLEKRENLEDQEELDNLEILEKHEFVEIFWWISATIFTIVSLLDTLTAMKVRHNS